MTMLRMSMQVHIFVNTIEEIESKQRSVSSILAIFYIIFVFSHFLQMREPVITNLQFNYDSFDVHSS